MTNITFSISKDLHQRIRAHPEIKWSEIVRRSIREFLLKIEEREKITTEQLKEILGKDTLEIIDSLDPKLETKFTEKIDKMEQERLQNLQNLERSKKK
ncbi:MAG: hypothetical protein ACTSWX_01035 [Promethearchaeota archaeon]